VIRGCTAGTWVDWEGRRGWHEARNQGGERRVGFVGGYNGRVRLTPVRKNRPNSKKFFLTSNKWFPPLAVVGDDHNFLFPDCWITHL
jgi:hypothetical protein